MIPTVLLFDIDGTILSSAGAGRRAVEATLAERFTQSAPCDFGFGGMTDRGIFRKALAARATSVGSQTGEPATDLDVTDRDDEATNTLIESLIDTYLNHLAAQVETLSFNGNAPLSEANAPPSLVVHPGVVDVLDGVRNRPNVALGLGTGNVERGARIKLGRTGLNPYFDFGGFGCDAELRAELIEAGARRGAAKLGRPFQECRVVIIGDTPHDVSAAHAIGAECVAVATGFVSAQELAACAPEVTLDDLTAPGLVDFLLGRRTTL